MSPVIYSVRLNSDNPDEARIIAAIERSQAEHGRAGLRKIVREAFGAMFNQRDDTQRMLDRQDEMLRILDRLARSGVSVGELEQAAGVGEIDSEVVKNVIGAFKPGRSRE